MALWHLGDNFTSDIVVIAGVGKAQQLLLIRRKHEPFKDCWALPGGFVNSLTPPNTVFEAAESHVQAAVRELQEETGITAQEADFRLIGVYDAFGRDPRAEGNQRVVTQAFLYVTSIEPNVQAGDDAADARWFSLSAVLNGDIELAFDHFDMIRQAMGHC
jgi:8-oxo-dGTP diphosphatase